ncbi:Lcl domain-containing protein [Jiulongibacter sediminis]|uniref:Lcl C-terminal domain-containing protein n=1 Tax=Jiulongibacter sediminis TaxID=1605367 RepID=A0A0P7C3M6_9BACT|nr:DUF1566 domain-containing protein [Jiulongibacter sediminis]KPM48917.1 hypothetical protein AFM12_10205 [Jiulongibacter sediminis]TBX25446.1 hypothetical protein TK44_10210 [Jiulongibacter sediminis]
MKTFYIFLLILAVPLISVFSQNLDISGKARVKVMEPASNSAKIVTREPDGTLSQLTENSATYTVGDFAQGGIIFWVSPDTKHGKVISLYDAGSTTWSNITNTQIGSTAQSLINGAGNSVAITLQDGHIVSAAEHCLKLSYSGYNDWYLPSLNEMGLVDSVKSVIDSSSTANGGESLSTSKLYWTSTEYSSTVYYYDFSLGFASLAVKSTNQLVRAIRSF